MESEGSYQRIFGSVLWSEVESQWDRKTAIKEKKERGRSARSIRKPKGEKFTEGFYKKLKSE